MRTNPRQSDKRGVAPPDPLSVMYVIGSFLGFAGSAQRYRQYFRRMPGWHIHPLVVTIPPHKHKTVDSIGANGEKDRTPRLADQGLVWHQSVEGVPTTVIRTFLKNGWLRRCMLFLLAFWLLLTRKDIHLVHVLQQAKVKTLPYALLLKAFSLPKVLSITQEINLSHIPLIRWLQRIQYNCYDGVICQSERQHSILSELHVRPDLIIVPNGVDTARLRPLPTEADKHALRSRLGLSRDALLFLYVGSVQPRKGTDVLLEAWKEVIASRPGLRLLIVGPRFDLTQPRWVGFAATIQALLKARGMSDSVTFYGYRPDVLEFLQAADGFVFPSDKEGLPNAVLEAMACGLPCILTPFFGCSTYLGVAAEHFLLSERTPEALAHAIHTLAGWSPEQRAALGANSRQLMLATMSMDRAVGVHCELYRRLLGHPGPGFGSGPESA